MTTNILLVDDHPIVQEAVVALLEATGSFSKVSTAISLAAAQSMLRQDTDYALILLDLQLQDSVGTTAMTTLRGLYAQIPILIFSATATNETIVEAFKGGASGFVSKSTPASTLLEAIKVVLAGGIYLPFETSQRLGYDPRVAVEPSERADEPSAMPTNQDTLTQLGLSQKQLAVLQALLGGCSNKDIGERLFMAEGTVKTHLNAVYRKLKVKNRSQAILMARDLRFPLLPVAVPVADRN